VLACGYLFTATMTVLHALTFPGLFSAQGLLGAGPQSTVWLYMFWHGGFPVFILLFSRLQHAEFAADASLARMARYFVRWGAASIALALVFGMVAVDGHDWLSPLLVNGKYSATMLVVMPVVWSLSGLALLALWRMRRSTVLDLWLMVVMCAWLIDIALSAMLNGSRFDLGFYVGRIYGLAAANFVLMVLLVENGALYVNLMQMANEMRRLSGTDALTGLANRRTFDAALDQEWRRALRKKSTLSLLMIDIDYFKHYNDAYGHLQGDACLREVAGVLGRFSRRAGDLSARYGGEEFVVLLPLTDGNEACLVGQEICQALAALCLPHSHSAVASHVTVSIGVGVVGCAARTMERTEGADPAADIDVTAGDASADLLLECADQALYRTKSSTRNGVSLGRRLVIDESRVAALAAA
jgi:diguanylate cyclase (GGDEF)-like protein